jgi:hypothetical protein
MRKHYNVSYTFLNVGCTYETTDFYTFVNKLNWLDEQDEVLHNSIKVWTEEK